MQCVLNGALIQSSLRACVSLKTRRQTPAKSLQLLQNHCHGSDQAQQTRLVMFMIISLARQGTYI